MSCDDFLKVLWKEQWKLGVITRKIEASYNKLISIHALKKPENDKVVMWVYKQLSISVDFLKIVAGGMWTFLKSYLVPLICAWYMFIYKTILGIIPTYLSSL